MSTDNNTERLQREIDAQRARVDETIDSLQARLSPGQLVDELLAYTKSGGGAFVGNLGKTAVANPVPVALLGVSLAWLMAKPTPDFLRRRPRERVDAGAAVRRRPIPGHADQR